MLNFAPAYPEIFVLSMACIVLLVDLFLNDQTRIFTYLLAQITLIIAFVLTLHGMSVARELTFSGMFLRDQMGDVLKLSIYSATFITFLYAKDYLRDRATFKGEYYVLGLFGVLGMMVLVSAANFLAVYLGLELLSLSLYALVAMQRDSSTASESAIKYFILGAIASGMLLYGMSMLYGATGSLDLAVISERILHTDDKLIAVFGLVFLMVGVSFKLGAVPFHMWIPDVYHGAPTAVTLYIASAPKIAAFAMLMRILVNGLLPLHDQWQEILIVLSIMSMGLGNVIAIAQVNIKRMLAYSAISHVGFLMLGVLTSTNAGYAASMFYAITYTLMSLGGFGMVILMSREGFEADKLDDYKGLNERSPWFAFMMLILMFSMAGVPPFLGFWAKLTVLEQVVTTSGLLWLAIVAVIFSIIGAFYYLRVIKLMYFDKPESMLIISASMDTKYMLSLNSLAVLGLGLFPSGLMTLCLASF